MASRILFFGLLVACFVALAVEAQKDFCVADLSLKANQDGMYPCKDPKNVGANDFSFSGLQIPPNITKAIHGGFTPVFDQQLPGLNRLGISFFRFDFEVDGFVPPHYHPRGTEIWTVLQGSVQVWFNTSAPENRQFTKVACKGDVFVVPKGLVHNLKNVGKTKAIVIGSFSHQNPGVILLNN